MFARYYFINGSVTVKGVVDADLFSGTVGTRSVFSNPADAYRGAIAEVAKKAGVDTRDVYCRSFKRVI